MGDNVTHVSDNDFEAQVLSSDRPVLVDFWAEWCVPCHMVSPVVEELARDFADRMKAAKLNVDDNPETTKKYRVMSIPTLIVFKDGEEKARVVGARGREAILREIEPHIAA
jgi:thioredoxin 1